MITREFTVGDRIVSLTAKLWRPGGIPVVLGVTETVTFRMVSVFAGTVKVNDQPATIVSLGSLVTNTPAEVRYDWAAADVDTAGEYAGWFTRTLAGETEHFPAQDHSDPHLKIVFRSDA